MIEVSKLLIEILNAYPPLNLVVQNKIFPLIANDSVQFPFVIYSLGEVPLQTKDACGYDVNVVVWFDQKFITEAMEMADLLKDLVETQDWEFQNTNVDFDVNTQKIFTEINFKIIK